MVRVARRVIAVAVLAIAGSTGVASLEHGRTSNSKGSWAASFGYGKDAWSVILQTKRVGVSTCLDVKLASLTDNRQASGCVFPAVRARGQRHWIADPLGTSNSLTRRPEAVIAGAVPRPDSAVRMTFTNTPIVTVHGVKCGNDRDSTTIRALQLPKRVGSEKWFQVVVADSTLRCPIGIAYLERPTSFH